MSFNEVTEEKTFAVVFCVNLPYGVRKHPWIYGLGEEVN